MARTYDINTADWLAVLKLLARNGKLQEHIEMLSTRTKPNTKTRIRVTHNTLAIDYTNLIPTKD